MALQGPFFLAGTKFWQQKGVFFQSMVFVSQITL
jgi:hypothetical protein